MAVAGVVLASGPELSGRAGARPVLLAAVAAVGFGLALLAIAEGSRHSTLMTLVTMRVTSVTLLASPWWWRWAAGRRGPSSSSARATSGWWRWSASATSAANLSFGLASRRDDVSVVSVLGSLYPVVTVLLARVLHARAARGRVAARPACARGALRQPRRRAARRGRCADRRPSARQPPIGAIGCAVVTTIAQRDTSAP